MSFTAVISQVCEEKLGGVKLKKDQSLAVQSLLRRRDVLAVLPKGYGKSLIFRVFAEAVECYTNGMFRLSVLVVCYFLVFSRIRYWRQIRQLKWLEKTAI